jgi:hypothetical protein
MLKGVFLSKKEERDISKAVVRLWTNFARSSSPTPNPGRRLPNLGCMQIIVEIKTKCFGLFYNVLSDYNQCSVYK